MCIYYKDRKDLHYTKQEHVIPAAIGGIQKLPKEYVSDEFNSDISKLEQAFFREGIISMPRQMVGPGKRGSLSQSKATKSKVHLITGAKEDDIFAMGYTTQSKTYEIPHVRLNLLTGVQELCFPNLGQDMDAAIRQFRDDCNAAESLKIKTIIENEVPAHIILIGIQNGIEENSNCFVIRNENSEIDVSNIIKKIGASLQLNSTEYKTLNYLPRGHGKANFRLDYFRIYGKIAFNFLADVKGVDFVQQNQFDQVRNWIANGGEYPFVRLAPKSKDILSQMNIPLPEDAHTIYIGGSRNQLIAQVFLYGGFSVIMQLSNENPDHGLTAVMICDWKNKKEYDLAEWLNANNFL